VAGSKKCSDRVSIAASTVAPVLTFERALKRPTNVEPAADSSPAR